MSLSCSYDFAMDGWWYEIQNQSDFKPLNTTKRKRCASCKTLIDINSDCIKFQRFRSPVTDIEERICDDAVQLANWYLCESCGEIYLNLEAIGYCYFLGDDLRQNLRDYWDLTEFEPDNQRMERTGKNHDN